MGWELFGLYLFTRLDNIKEFSVFGMIVTGLALLVAIIGMMMNDPEEGYEKRYYIKCKTVADKVKWWFVAFVMVLIFVPGQKAAIFIVAGTGVVEAAKTDTAQRIAGKSVSVVEKYLDEMLAEQTKKDEKK